MSVSPSGSIRTLEDARDAAREQRRAGVKGNITITIHAGTYFLPETLVLGPEDSGTTWEAAHGEHPVVSGGHMITGWTKGEGGVWSAYVSGPVFRQLFIDGRRAVRARTPNDSTLKFVGGGTPNQPLKLHFAGSDIRKEWVKQPDVEVVGAMGWSQFRSPVVGLDPATHEVTLAPTQNSANEENARYFIENDPTAMDAPGEWYLDRALHRVSYIPMRGENMGRVQAVAAGLQRLISIQGKPEAGAVVKDVVLRGLTFEHADWSMGPKGYLDVQAASPAGSAVEAVGTAGLRVERCTFARDGGYGLALGRGSQQSQVLANEFYDMGAGGIKVGEAELRTNRAEQNFRNMIADNEIHDLGKVFAGGVGVWVLQSGSNQIVHNHVHDLYYTAISVGWTWGYGPNQSNTNLIAFNDLHAIGKDVLSDMGAVYTLGVQPGTVIRNNRIYDVSAFTYGGWGIYLDEGSSEILVEDNVVYRCKSAGFHQHYGRENTVRNNIFALNHEHELMRTKGEPHLSFTMQNNIVYFDQGDLLGGNWTDGSFTMKNNLYFDTRGTASVTGKDEGSRVADPMFVNVKNLDLRLKPASPALAMGFHPIDMTKVGLRGAVGAESW